MSAIDPSIFFESWLPETYARLKSNVDMSSVADCSLVAEVGDDAWSLAVVRAELEVRRGRTDAAPTFRVRTARASFQRLLADSLQLAERQSSALRMLRLDAETCRLVSNVPGSLQLRVLDGDTTHDVRFGPGQADFTAAACSVTCEYSDLQTVQQGDVHPMDLFMSGKLKLDGNIEIAMALGGLFL